MTGEGVGDHFGFGEFFKEPDEIVPRVESSTAAAFDQSIPDGVALFSSLATHEEPVLRAQFGVL